MLAHKLQIKKTKNNYKVLNDPQKQPLDHLRHSEHNEFSFKIQMLIFTHF